MLFLLAHQDDEYFVLPRIAAEVRLGSEILVAYTTDGAGYGACSARRLEESRRALRRWGIQADQIQPVGGQLGVADGGSHECLFRLAEAFSSLGNFDRIFAPAWEGGHVDHDAAHLVAAWLRGRQPGLDLYEFSLYRAWGSRGPFFQCGNLILRERDLLFDRVSVRASLDWFLGFLHYRSQMGSFLGLAPLSAYPILVRRRLVCQRVAWREYRIRPHSGSLFYERRFKVSFDVFRSTVEAFVASIADSERQNSKGGRAKSTTPP